MTETILIKTTKEFKEQLEKEAKNRGLNLSAFIRMILTERMAK